MMSNSPTIAEAPAVPRAPIARRAGGAMRFVAHSASKAWALLFSSSQKRGLIWTYLRIRAKHFLTKLRPGYHARHETICGTRLECLDYFTLAYMFEIIFLDRDYEFSSSERQPRIIDCGANIGVAVLFFKQMFPECRIVAFEPEPAAFQALQRNVAAGGWRDVELMNQAVSDAAGAGELYFDPEKPGSDVASLRAASGLRGVKSVPTAKLSDFVQSEVDFLKLDIEGSETAVITELDSSGKLRCVRQMAVEFHQHLAGPEDLPRILSALECNGFAYEIRSGADAPQSGLPLNSLIRAWRKNGVAAPQQ